MKRNSSRLMCMLLGLVWYAESHATTYYVSSSVGRDAQAGTSPGTPWQTLAKVNRAGLSTGDRVYLLAGDEWDDEFLDVHWSGTPGNHAVIGAYYSNSDGVVSYGLGPGNRRPLIDDHYRWGAQTFTSVTGSNPGIDVGGSYVDVENIEVRQSGWGIRVVGQTDVSLTNLFINGAYQCGILATSVENLTIQSSEFFNAEAARGIFGENVNWCSTIGIQRSHNITVQNNFIHESWGEGINTYDGSTNAVIQGNVLYANRAAGIYMGALNGAAIHGNLILGTADRRFWRTSLSAGPGIAMDNESYEFAGAAPTSHGDPTAQGTLCPLGAYGDYAGRGSELCPDALQDVQIYDNLVVATSAGLAVWFTDYAADYTNVRVFGNTFVDNEQQLDLGGQNCRDYVVENNIFLSLTPGMVDVSGSNYGITFDANYWSQGLPKTVGNTPIASAADVFAGAQLERMSGWRSLESADQVDAQSFAPRAGSSTLGKGSSAGLFFDTDYFGNPLRDPVDLGAIAGLGRTSPASGAPPVPDSGESPPPIDSGSATAGVASPATVAPGQTFRVTGTFSATTSAQGAVLYFWLTPPNGHYVLKTAVVTDLRAQIPTPVTTTMTVPPDAVAGKYTIAAGAYAGSTAMRPYVSDFADVLVQ